MISFTDSRGRRWSVWSVRPNVDPGVLSQVPARLRDGWLVFAQGTERRHLSPIPERWWQLGEEELGELCALALSAAPSAPPPEVG